MFRECGWPAFAVLGLTVLAFLAGMIALGVAIFRPRVGVVLGAVALGVSCSVPAMGVGGTTIGRGVVDEAVSGGSIAPDQRERIRQVGYQEAAQCTTLGLSFGALPGVLALAALGVGAARRKVKRSEPS
jgi:hypothetical protein